MKKIKDDKDHADKIKLSLNLNAIEGQWAISNLEQMCENQGHGDRL